MITLDDLHREDLAGDEVMVHRHTIHPGISLLHAFLLL